jgi:hypothetical protein
MLVTDIIADTVPLFEKSSIDDLTWGVGDPNVSIRIPT